MRTVLTALALVAAQGQTALPVVIWGGSHVEIRVSDAKASVEFDCARGTIDGRLRADATGAFDIKGTFSPEHAGPERRHEPPPLKATYSGTIAKDTMTLKVVVDGQDPKGTTYTLTRGAAGDLRRCR